MAKAPLDRVENYSWEGRLTLPPCCHNFDLSLARCVAFIDGISGHLEVLACGVLMFFFFLPFPPDTVGMPTYSASRRYSIARKNASLIQIYD